MERKTYQEWKKQESKIFKRFMCLYFAGGVAIVFGVSFLPKGGWKEVTAADFPLLFFMSLGLVGMGLLIRQYSKVVSVLYKK